MLENRELMSSNSQFCCPLFCSLFCQLCLHPLTIFRPSLNQCCKFLFLKNCFAIDVLAFVFVILIIYGHESMNIENVWLEFVCSCCDHPRLPLTDVVQDFMHPKGLGLPLDMFLPLKWVILLPLLNLDC